ncbi:hypothetical protein D3C86_2146820 [compost metagenome]
MITSTLSISGCMAACDCDCAGKGGCGLRMMVSVKAAWDTEVTQRQKRANNQRMKRYLQA